MSVVFERLLPPGPPADSPQLMAELREQLPAPQGRAGVLVNMVATLDGHITIGGRSGPIGGDGDKELFHALRTAVDAVLVGTGTLRAERYGRLVRKPERRAAREALGLDPDPVGMLMTRSGRIPWDAPLFEAEGQRVVIYTGPQGLDEPAPATVTATVEVVALEDVSPARALADILERHGVRSVLCEGGPHLNRSLLADRVMDELFLALGALVAGGEPERTLVMGGGPFAGPIEARLRWVLRHGDELFLRYGL